MLHGTKHKERCFYIKVSNFSIDHGKPLFIGPFKNKGQAQTTIDRARHEGMKLHDGNEFIDDCTLNVIIIGGTQAKREGMKEPLISIPNIKEWEHNFAGGDIYKSNRGRPKKEETVSLESTPNSPKEKKVETTTTYVRPQPQIYPSSEIQTLEKEEFVIAVDDSLIVAWLYQKGISGSIIPQIQHESQVAGKVVIGIIPPWFMWAAKYFGIINIPNKRKEDVLSPEEIDRRGGTIDWYYTRKGKGEQHK